MLLLYNKLQLFSIVYLIENNGNLYYNMCMIYENITGGHFLSRPNRFIANIKINNKVETVHVKNTGRCRELLTDNAKVFCQHFDSSTRKTDYDLISVYKGDRLINMDSQAPNKVFFEFLKNGGLFSDIKSIKPESKFENSRFDFYVERKNTKVYIEVKGVTLEENGVVLFPDAPSERGVKHLNELIKAKEIGFEAYVVFVVQMEKVKYFTPNVATHPQFAETLKKAYDKGVNILCYDCLVSPDSLSINQPVKVNL